MTQEVSNPLQDIIAKMAKTQVRGECAKLKERMAAGRERNLRILMEADRDSS